jgi:hypothetical protein
MNALFPSASRHTRTTVAAFTLIELLVVIANTLWTSPQRTTDDNTLPVVTELNAWSSSEDKIFAPHGAYGPILKQGDSSNQGSGGAPSAQIGAAGGHLGLLDGSVTWKEMRQMRIYRGSRMWDAGGCFTAW